MRIFLLAIILSLISLNGFGQMEKADKYFMRREYNRAIPLYEKVILSDDSVLHRAALQKLAEAYRLQGLYPQAEKTYKILLAQNANPPASLLYNFAQVLKANKKYDEAANSYERYIQLVPEDVNAKKAYRFCKDVSVHYAKAREYEVVALSDINTTTAEYSPFVMKSKLVYVAERGVFDKKTGTFEEADGDLFLQYYYSDIVGIAVSKSKIFSETLGPLFHLGPACVSADEKTLYFTKVLPGKNKDAAAISAICTASYSAKGWMQVSQLNLFVGEAQAAQPAISKDGSTLYFSSDMSGGFGGKDIWMCEKKGDQWSTPLNLGPDINTSGDEMFPLLRTDDLLFFSSNGLPGYGGLDIYSASKITDKWILNRNEGLDLNSNSDDFGAAFLNDSIGYFSSNREGGKGLDDIYRFRFRKKTTELFGILLLTENVKDYAQYKKLLLMDEGGKTLDSTVTNARGYFNFRYLEADKKYLVSVEETDPVLIHKARFYLAQNDSSIQRVSSKMNEKRFVLRNLPFQAGGLPELYTDDDMVLAGTLQYGDQAMPFKKVKVKIINEFGDVVKESFTNGLGAFAFRNIPADQNYVVSVDDSELSLPEGTRIALLNKSGKTIKVFYKTDGKIQFQVLQADTAFLAEMNAEDASLVMGINGYMYDQNMKPLVNAKVKIIDIDKTIVQEWITNAAGKFNFKNLPADKSYMFELDVTNDALKLVHKIYIADSKGKVYKTVDLAGSKLVFKMMEVDKFFLGEFAVDDPWLKVSELLQRDSLSNDSLQAIAITIVENIYYGYGDYQLDANAEMILSKAARALKESPKLMMEISSHTDSKASADYNMNLSKMRAQTAVDYLIKSGIDPERLKATGYGESRLLNKCSDNQECSEEEHRMNRRTEFKFMNSGTIK